MTIQADAISKGRARFAGFFQDRSLSLFCMKVVRNFIMLVPAIAIAGCLPNFPKAEFDEQAIVARLLMDTRKYIFVTPNATANGNLKVWGGTTYATGIEGADAFCMQQYPLVTSPATLPVGIYKALIVDGTNRTACESSIDCASVAATDLKDWVLTPNTSYFLPGGTEILRTNAQPIVPFTSATARLLVSTGFASSGSWRTGMLSGWGPAPTNCTAWTSSAAVVGYCGVGGSNDEQSTQGITVGCGCNATTVKLLCVRQ